MSLRECDLVLDTPELGAPCVRVEECVAGARIAVPRLADASRIYVQAVDAKWDGLSVRVFDLFHNAA